VPTWLYESVQLAGPVEIMSNTELTRHLDLFAERFEAWLAPKQPWTADKVTPARYKMLAKAIVGITMTVETVEGSLKLNQHKSDADHVAIAQALSARPDAASRALAAQMAAMRPHLTYAAADAIPSPVAANLDQVLPGAAGA
ncbi:MAG: FMN-binding negative transcriptional regulator, partial [Rhizobiales bacterium]|nr:FMN-binding negative transcriptional regulator [Hyphomicrobiales bacterium]